MTRQNGQQEVSREERINTQKDMTADENAQQTASKLAREQVRAKNPDFLAQLQQPDADSAEYDWLEAEFGPIFSGAKILGNRDPHHRHRRMWLNRNKAERMVTEHESGRLCKGEVAEIAHRVHKRDDRELSDIADPMTTDEKRAVRDAMEIATNMESLSVGRAGLKAASEVTVQSKTEKVEAEEGEEGLVDKFKGVYR
jgi:hypothetical protein